MQLRFPIKIQNTTHLRLISTASTANNSTWIVAPDAYLGSGELEMCACISDIAYKGCRTRMDQRYRKCTPHSMTAAKSQPMSTGKQCGKRSIPS